MKRGLSFIMLLALVCSLAFSGGQQEQADAVTVAIMMPTKEQPIWSAQGELIKEQMEAKGYKTILEFAEDIAELQLSQVENAITRGADYLIMGSVDSYAVTDTVQKAREAGVAVIASDRLIMNTEAVDYYVTFDLFRLGEIQGEYIVSALGLDKGEKGPFNLEIFSGSPDDPNSIPFYEGAMSKLQPFLDKGSLIVKSGQTGLDVTGTLKWDGSKAQSRLDNIIGAYYTDSKIDAVLAAADCLAMGVISSLSSFGYGKSDDLPFPVVVGQDCEIPAIKSIIAGEQSMSVFLDQFVLSEKMANLVAALEAGEPVVPDTTYNNNVFDVPTLLYEPVLVDINNYDLLIERGFYTREDLGL